MAENREREAEKARCRVDFSRQGRPYEIARDVLGREGERAETGAKLMREEGGKRNLHKRETQRGKKKCER